MPYFPLNFLTDPENAEMVKFLTLSLKTLIVCIVQILVFYCFRHHLSKTGTPWARGGWLASFFFLLGVIANLFAVINVILLMTSRVEYSFAELLPIYLISFFNVVLFRIAHWKNVNRGYLPSGILDGMIIFFAILTSFVVGFIFYTAFG